MEKYNEEFLELISEFINDDRYCETKKYISHKNTTTYQHQINVAYLCFLYIKKKNKNNYDLSSTIRGAMLHDFYLYDWHDRLNVHRRPHGFFHPLTSYLNAKKIYHLNKIEKDIITKHMFPLTFMIPSYKETWLVIRMDKKSSILEMKGKKIEL